MSLDFVKLTKLMMLTTSPADGEAMNAMRMANAMISKERMSWQEVMKVRLEGDPISEEKKKSDRQDKKARIKNMLEACLEEVHGDAREFIESLEEQFEKYGNLTEKQFNALKKFFDRITG